MKTNLNPTPIRADGKRPAIGAAFDDMDVAIGELQKEFGILKNKLACVTLPEPATPPEKTSAPEGSTDVERTIRSHITRICLLTVDVVALRDRIEL